MPAPKQDAVQGDAKDRITRRRSALRRFVSAYERWVKGHEWTEKGARASREDADALHSAYLEAREALK